MRRYGGGMLYAALPLHIQRGCFRIRTHDQQVTKVQLYCMNLIQYYIERYWPDMKQNQAEDNKVSAGVINECHR